MPRLLTIDEAAAEVSVPPGSLRTAAREHGPLVKMGHTVRIYPGDIPELIDRCRDQPRTRAMPMIDSQVHAYERDHPGRPWAGVLAGPAEVTGDAVRS